MHKKVEIAALFHSRVTQIAEKQKKAYAPILNKKIKEQTTFYPVVSSLVAVEKAAKEEAEKIQRSRGRVIASKLVKPSSRLKPLHTPSDPIKSIDNRKEECRYPIKWKEKRVQIDALVAALEKSLTEADDMMACVNRIQSLKQDDCAQNEEYSKLADPMQLKSTMLSILNGIKLHIEHLINTTATSENSRNVESCTDSSQKPDVDGESITPRKPEDINRTISYEKVASASLRAAKKLLRSLEQQNGKQKSHIYGEKEVHLIARQKRCQAKPIWQPVVNELSQYSEKKETEDPRM